MAMQTEQTKQKQQSNNYGFIFYEKILIKFLNCGADKILGVSKKFGISGSKLLFFSSLEDPQFNWTFTERAHIKLSTLFGAILEVYQYKEDDHLAPKIWIEPYFIRKDKMDTITRIVMDAARRIYNKQEIPVMTEWFIYATMKRDPDIAMIFKMKLKRDAKKLGCTEKEICEELRRRSITKRASYQMEIEMENENQNQ